MLIARIVGTLIGAAICITGVVLVWMWGMEAAEASPIDYSGLPRAFGWTVFALLGLFIAGVSLAVGPKKLID